jgi:hypothetical protein
MSVVTRPVVGRVEPRNPLAEINVEIVIPTRWDRRTPVTDALGSSKPPIARLVS